MIALTGKRALVTGGSRGIGAAMAVALTGAGADVAISYEHAADRARHRGSDRGDGGRGVAIKADADDPDAINAMVERAAEAFGGLDILVNNAATARHGTLADLALADIDPMLDVNIRGTVLTTKAAIPHLADGGRVITIGSNVAERVPFPGLTVYALTKSAQLSFTRGLAHELVGRDITTNVVQPGPAGTDLNPADLETSDSTRSFTALKRYGTAEEIAGLVTFLASSPASFITGSAITADGGFNA